MSALQTMLGGREDSAEERLNRLLADMAREQRELTESMETMKTRGQDRTYRFKEQMGRKLMNSQIYAKLQAYGLVEKGE